MTQPAARVAKLRRYKVATYYTDDGRPMKMARITAYTLWFSEAWAGCKVYEVEAFDGKAAKYNARLMRLEFEITALGRSASQGGKG